MAAEDISVQSAVLGQMTTFVAREGINCINTATAIVEILAALADCREEGEPLFPAVYVCCDLKDLLRCSVAAQHLPLGTGPADRTETVKRAVKLAAPLARGGWCVYIERTEDGQHFRYGVFAPMMAPGSVSTEDLVLAVPNREKPIVLIAQRAPNVVEVRGRSGKHVNCRLTPTSSAEGDDPHVAVSDLVSAMTRDVPIEFREPVGNGLKRLLRHCLPRCRGTLIAVMKSGATVLPDEFGKAVVFSEPYSYLIQMKEFITSQAASSMAAVQAVENAIEGMIRSDGITVFRPDASVVGYRAFIRLKDEKHFVSETSGGGRTRAFEALCVLEHHLSAAFFRSQDGQTNYRGFDVK